MDRVEELNARIALRNVASSAPEMSFYPRPVSTSHMLFPIVDAVPPTSVGIQSRHAVKFLPATTAPFRNFDVRIDSDLRNIKYALQADDRAVYVPAVSSDLYVTHVPKTDVAQPHPLLFVHAVSSQPFLKYKEQIFNNVRMR